MEIYRELAKLSQCKRTRMMYAKNHARVYKKKKSLLRAATL